MATRHLSSPLVRVEGFPQRFQDTSQQWLALHHTMWQQQQQQQQQQQHHHHHQQQQQLQLQHNQQQELYHQPHHHQQPPPPQPKHTMSPSASNAASLLGSSLDYHHATGCLTPLQPPHTPSLMAPPPVSFFHIPNGRPSSAVWSAGVGCPSENPLFGDSGQYGSGTPGGLESISSFSHHSAGYPAWMMGEHKSPTLPPLSLLQYHSHNQQDASIPVLCPDIAHCLTSNNNNNNNNTSSSSSTRRSSSSASGSTSSGLL